MAIDRSSQTWPDSEVYAVDAEHSGYKANLLQNARYQMAATGGRLVVRGNGNKTRVSFYAKDGRECIVWFPTEPRVKDLEIADLKEAIREMSGHNAFTLFGPLVRGK